MRRSKSISLAAILLTALGAVEMFSAVRILAAGSAGLPPAPELRAAGIESGPPFWAGLLFMVVAVASLFAAYGLWKNQKWAKVVAIVTSALIGLFAVGDLVGAAMAGLAAAAAAFAGLVLVCAMVVFLVLRREAQPQTA